MPLPSSRLHIFSDPFMLASWAEHEHFILGVTTDGDPQQYVIGVPGTYSQEGRIAAKSLGFSQFKCPKKERPRVGDNGYWLMFVDL